MSDEHVPTHAGIGAPPGKTGNQKEKTWACNHRCGDATTVFRNTDVVTCKSVLSWLRFAVVS